MFKTFNKVLKPPAAIFALFFVNFHVNFPKFQYKQNLDISNILPLTEKLLILRFDCICWAQLDLVRGGHIPRNFPVVPGNGSGYICKLAFHRQK